MVHTPERWAQTLIQHLWKLFLTQWADRCQAQHHRDAQATQDRARQALYPRLERVYADQHKYIHEHQHLFEMPLAARRPLPARQIETWLQVVEALRMASVTEQHRRTTTQHKTIDNYFTRKDTN